jgi:hypothetical protein
MDAARGSDRSFIEQKSVTILLAANNQWHFDEQQATNLVLFT